MSRALVHGAEGDAGSSTCAIPQRPDMSTNSQGGQEVNNAQFSGNSRTHIGNVYHNTYTNAEQSDPYETKAHNLMTTLEFQGMRDRLFTVSPACASTCSWFLQTTEYMKWRDPACRTLHNGVLWIKGKAGTGKSTLMRYIHDHAEKRYLDSIVIAFFFNGRSPTTLAKSTEGMYRSLLHQLYENVRHLKHDAARRTLTTKQHTLSLGILEDLLRKAVLGLRLKEAVICYIDALDECADDQVRSAVECFENLSQTATHEQIRFLVCFSSRYYPQITMRTHMESRLDTLREHWDDITKYIGDYLTIPSAMKRELQAEIERRCSGVFLWVVIVVRMLKERFDKGGTRSQLHEILTSLPKELDALFAQISKSADPGFSVAMRWVLLTTSPLSPQQLYFAIRAGENKLDSALWNRDEVSEESIQSYILHTSRGLIECTDSESVSLPSSSTKTQFVHGSVKEYLLSGSLARLESVSEQDLMARSQAKMAKDCQHYLELCIHGRDDMSSKNTKTGKSPLDDSYPLSHYAVTNVFEHLQSAFDGGSSQYDLLNYPLSHYLTVRRHLDFMPSLIPFDLSEHCVNFFRALVQSDRCAPAESYMQDSAWKNCSPTNRIACQETCAASSSPSAPVLKTRNGKARIDILQQPGNKSIQLLRLLLKQRVNIRRSLEKCSDIWLSTYESPLTLAIKSGSKDMMQLLLDYRAPPNRPDPRHGLRPLHVVFEIASRSMLSQIELLTSRGANVNLPPASEYRSYWHATTMLHVAVSRGLSRDYIAIIRALLKAGAAVNATNAHGETPMMIAASRAKLEAAQLLLTHGANPFHRGTRLPTAVTATARSILGPLMYEIRLRALKGRDGFLPVAERPPPPDKQRRSRIPGPAQSRTCKQRAKRPLQYRRLPPYLRSYPVTSERDDQQAEPGADEDSDGCDAELEKWLKSGRGVEGEARDLINYC